MTDERLLLLRVNEHHRSTFKFSNRRVIGSGRSTGDNVTRDFTDTCCPRH